MEAPTFRIEKKVYLADTDTTGIVYYARHLEWLEAARVEFIAHAYKPLTRMIAEDAISFVPVSLKIDYASPAQFEDLLTVELWVKAVEKIKLLLEYRITKSVGEKKLTISTAEITLVCINTAKGNRPTRIPDFLTAALEKWIGTFSRDDARMA